MIIMNINNTAFYNLCVLLYNNNKDNLIMIMMTEKQDNHDVNENDNEDDDDEIKIVKMSSTTMFSITKAR